MNKRFFLVEISCVVSVGNQLPRLGSVTSCQKSRLRSPSKQSSGAFLSAPCAQWGPHSAPRYGERRNRHTRSRGCRTGRLCRARRMTTRHTRLRIRLSLECEPSALPKERLTHPHKTGLFISITSIIRTFVFLNSLLHNNGIKHRAQRHGLRR